MPLHLSVAASEHLPPQFVQQVAALREIVADDALPDAGPLAQWLLDRLGATAAEVSLTVDGVPLRSLVPHRLPLVSGAVIVCGLPARKRPRNRTTAAPRSGAPVLALAVTGGPDAGKVLELARGEHVLGRDGAALLVDDPQLSRKHARITVDNRSVRITDLDSANGIVAEGRRVASAELVSGREISAGGSRMTLYLAGEPLPGVSPDEDLDSPVQVAAPAPDPRGKLTLLLAGLPLVAGVALAVITGMWFFLAFSAVSLLAAAIPYAAGRRKRRAFKAAVSAAAASDLQRRQQAAPDPARLVYGQLREAATGSAGSQPEHLWLRLGTADQEARIAAAGTPDLQVPVLQDAPLAVDLLATRRISCSGPATVLRRLLNSCLLQLGARALQSDLSVVCYGTADSMPPAARFLPGTVLASRPEVLAAQLRQDGRPLVLLITDRHDIADEVIESSDANLAIIRFSSPVPADEAQIQLVPGRGTLRRLGTSTAFQPDLVCAGTLERFARLAARAAATLPANISGTVPDSCGLEALLPGAEPTGLWARNAAAAGIPAVIGADATGPVTLDLASEGPHLLIAGTTGSGKSELLKSLVLSLAYQHPPEKLNFLFIDFKGGSGLGSVSGLPHSAGLLTDLTASQVGRALSWLRAEVTRRELELARLGVADIRDCPPTVLHRLMVVVDEFRMLADEVPQALPELMRVAALGRSLGIHLIMATQRPQGAISADIRANVTSSVALRVQTALESADLVGTSAAADIAVASPGRAFLRIGPAAAREFQSASASIRAAPSGPAAAVLHEWLEPHRINRPDLERLQPDGQDPDPAAKLVTRLHQAATAAGSVAAIQLPPPLPERLELHTLPQPSKPDSLRLGLFDLPAQQRQLAMDWVPEDDGHLAALGASGSGTQLVLKAATAGLLGSAAERHVYVLDGDGSLRFAAAAERTGAYAGPTETERAARVLKRLASETAKRLASVAMDTNADSPRAVPLIVIVSGWGRWASAFRSGKFGWAEECLLDLARDGAAAAVVLCIAGDRELAAARILGMLPNKLFFPAFTGPETQMAWPKLPPMDDIPGRALAQGPFVPAMEAVAHVVDDPAQGLQPREAKQQPFRIEPLPDQVPADQLPDDEQPEDMLIIGVEGDELGPASLRITPGEAVLVLGAAGSGKTNLIELLERQASTRYNCLRPPQGTDASAYWSSLDLFGTGTLLLIDDAHLLAPPAHQRVAKLLEAGAAAVVAARPGPALLQQVPAALTARSNGRGFILSPAAAADGDLLGVRLDAARCPPGRAYRVEYGMAVPLQTGYVRA
ncbi:FHA domain-containing protein [Arthrobacter crystallopoietes BAB-32]|uniref:FHA domain-containing protein n=1 Tax=Arthrobacter crystallopoietes BAB-32 TaxID=1246476 RepID=N1VBK3_9MICC|nr:FtsK/SpoIIIE domain-containing protein [Arthrobacter crystallopoietes]EMY35678.1 FHA domain-containing protein [Arthrobacter crystallopoietes BAB-32]